jgi:hypothetical protein
MKIHALLAAFILPIAIMFMITGSLYTWGIKGNYDNEVFEISLNKPINADIGELTKLAESELNTLKITTPEGKPKLKVFGSHILLEWTGSSKDLILEPTDNNLVAKLTVKHTSWYRNLVQLHKAKGGTAFKVYAVIFAVVFGILLVSGFIMAWQTPKLKVATLASSLIGFISFAALVCLS